MELKEGMYVRTDNGQITKNYGEFYEPSVDIGVGIMEEINGVWIDKEHVDYIDKKHIVKASFNIIDLIEVGDVIAIKEDIDRFARVFILGIYEPVLLKEVKAKLESRNLILDRVLTKEQFEREAYKI